MTKILNKLIADLKEENFSEEVNVKLNSSGETTSSIQTKRPLKTLNGESLEGTGDVTVSGGGNPSTHIVNNISDVTGDQSAHANKTWEIRSEIDLTTSTINIPEGITLSFKGGKFINGTINCITNDAFINARPFDVIFDLTTELIGVRATESYPEWWGAKADGLTTTDNRYTIQKSIDFAKNNGKLVISGGNYYCSVDDATVPSADSSLIIGSNTTIEFKDGSYLIVIPNTFRRYTLMSVKRADNVIIFSKNRLGGLKGDFIGDKLSDPSEYGTLFSTKWRCTNILVDGLEFADAYGDGINNNHYSGFINNPLEFESGNIDYITGLPVESSDHIRQVDNQTLLSSRFDAVVGETISYSRYGEFHVGGGSYGGLMGVSNGLLDLFFYDVNGDFISVYKNTEMYDRIKYPEGSASVRMVAAQSDDYFLYKTLVTTASQTTWEAKPNPISDKHKLFSNGVLMILGTDYTVAGNTITLTPAIGVKTLTLYEGVKPTIRASEITVGLTIKNCWIHDSSRNNISGTGIQNLHVHGCLIERAKGTLPMAGIDIEDYGIGNKNIKIEQNIFQNNGNYDLVFIDTWKAQVLNNQFLGDKGHRHLAIISTNGTNIRFNNNYFENGDIYMGGNSYWSNNYYKYVSVRLNSATLSNEFLYDSMIEDRCTSEGGVTVNNIVMQNTVDKYKQMGYSSDYMIVDSPYRRRLKNIRIVGEKSRLSTELYGGPDTEIDGFYCAKGTVNIRTGHANNIKANDISLNFVPLNELVVKYKNWEVVGPLAGIRVSGITNNTHSFELENINVNTEWIEYGKYAIIFYHPLKRLTIKNSSFIDLGTTGSNWSMIGVSGSVDEFSLMGTTIRTATAGGVIARASSTSSFYYENNTIENAVLNSVNNDILKDNLINGVRKSTYPVYSDNAAALTGGLVVGQEYTNLLGDKKIVI